MILSPDNFFSSDSNSLVLYLEVDCSKSKKINFTLLSTAVENSFRALLLVLCSVLFSMLL